MKINKTKKGVVIDFQGNILKSKGKYGVKITGDDDTPLTVKNAVFQNDKAYPIGMYKRVVKIGTVYNIATYIALKILEDK